MPVNPCDTCRIRYWLSVKQPEAMRLIVSACATCATNERSTYCRKHGQVFVQIAGSFVCGECYLEEAERLVSSRANYYERFQSELSPQQLVRLDDWLCRDPYVQAGSKEDQICFILALCATELGTTSEAVAAIVIANQNIAPLTHDPDRLA